MSRIGKQPITIPAGVAVKIEGQFVTVKGPQGEIKQPIVAGILIAQKENQLIVAPAKEGKQWSKFWGLTRALLQNNIIGVNEGFVKKLEMIGVGYKAAMTDSKTLKIEAGFSHSVIMKVPDDLTATAEKNSIVISGFDKQKVGQFAAKIRAIRPPEPYKGKGIRYQGEKVRRKEGKKAA
ncbi:MAG: 50S ribosomal protein L6, partial [Patescibacteria group bacterium]